MNEQKIKDFRELETKTEDNVFNIAKTLSFKTARVDYKKNLRVCEK